MADFYNVKEAAARLELAEATVRKYVRQGRIVAQKFGERSYIITEAALAEFEEKPRPIGRPKKEVVSG